MTKKLMLAMWTLYALLIGTAVAFADLPRTHERAPVPAVVGWYEPPACLRLEEIARQDCMYWLNKIGLEHMQAKQYDKAVARFSQVLAMQEFAVVYATRGAAYARLEKYREAHKDYTRAVQLDPRMVEPLANMAEIDHVFRRLPQALVHITRALELKPNRPEYLLLRAEILVSLGQPRRAARDVRQAIAETRSLPAGSNVAPQATDKSADAK
jgi:tetratricopeptide (TPR) repeat protein